MRFVKPLLSAGSDATPGRRRVRSNPRMQRLKRLLGGGSAGNEQLTAIVATLLLVLLAVEGVTILGIGALMTVHAFVGVLLIPVVALKIASTGWRMLRYYLRGEEYVRRGPPHVVLRMLVAPVVVASTIVLFASGIALLALDRTQGLVVGLHKASFVVWAGAFGLHLLTRLLNLLPALRQRLPGLGLRVALIGGALATGIVLATATLPAAEQLQDRMSARVGVDER